MCFINSDGATNYIRGNNFLRRGLLKRSDEDDLVRPIRKGRVVKIDEEWFVDLVAVWK